MNSQRLSALDICYLAFDLQKQLKRQLIRDVVFKPDNLYIRTDSSLIRYSIISGAPYIMYADSLPEGRRWLNIIEGGLIEDIEQVEGDRLLRFTIVLFDRLGKRKNYFLYLEFYKNGNIILTNSENKIMSSLRRSESSGQIYDCSKSETLNIVDLLINRELTPESADLIKKMNVMPWSERLTGSPPDFKGLQKQIKSCPSPHVIKDNEGEPIGFSVYGPPFVKDVIAKEAESLLEALTAYLKASETRRKRKLPDYRKQLNKARNKLITIEAELSEARKFGQFREYGELLLANLHSLRKGLAECHLDTLYHNRARKVIIPLNPALSPSQNAEEYFARARKAESSLKIIDKRLSQQREEIKKLEELAARTLDGDMPEIPARPTHKPKTRKLPFRHISLDNGWQIYAGKSAKTNDELTFSYARKDDIWFHAWQAAGSHLILRAPQKNMLPDKSLLTAAASLAAYYSKAKNSSKVSVIYTEVRYVRKVKKVPGKVTYADEKELMVEPKSPEVLLK